MKDTVIKKRKHELSLMNVILCAFVIFIHAASPTLHSADKASLVWAIMLPIWRCCACAVYGFIFLAGVKFSLGAQREDFSYLRYIKSRFTRVWIPYAAAVIVYFACFILWGYMAFDMGDFVKWLFDGSMASHFYFVVAIMQFYLLAPLWRLLIKKLDSPEWCAIILPMTLLVGQILGQYLPDLIAVFSPGYYYPYADRTFTTYIFWWVLGLIVGRHYERVKAFSLANFRGITVIFALTTVFNMVMCYLHFSGMANVYWLETIHIFYILCAVLFLFTLCTRLAGARLAKCSPISRIDRASYSIYLWHPMALYIADRALSRIGSPSLSLKFFVHMSFAYIGTVVVCVGVQLAADKLKKSLKRS